MKLANILMASRLKVLQRTNCFQLTIYYHSEIYYVVLNLTSHVTIKFSKPNAHHTSLIKKYLINIKSQT